MDAKLVTDVLKLVGLPGLVIVGWIVAAVTGQGRETATMWGLGLLASIIVSFFHARTRSFAEDLSHVISNTLNTAVKPLIETVHNMAEIEDNLIDEIVAMKEIYEGGLTIKQLVFLLPRTFDTFKWRVFRICFNVTTYKGNTIFERKNVEDTVVTQVCSNLEAMAEYNHILKHPAVSDSVKKAVSNIFDVLYGSEFTALEDYTQRVSLLLEIIRTELDKCSQVILDLLKSEAPTRATPRPARITGDDTRMSALGSDGI